MDEVAHHAEWNTRFRPYNLLWVSVMSAKHICLVLLFVALTACGGAEGRKSAYMQKGQGFFDSGSYEKARVEFKNVLQIDPKDVPARYMLAQTLEKLGDIRGAAGFYLAVIEADPKHRESLSRMAQLYLMGRNVDEAGKLADKMLALNPKDADALVITAGIKSLAKDLDGALADASSALEIAPKNANAAAIIASIKLQTDKPDEAIATLKALQEKDPKNATSKSLLARVYLQLGRAEEAEHVMREVIEQEPKQLSHRLMLVQLLIQAKKTDAAESALKDAVKATKGNEKDGNIARLGLVEFQAKARDADTAIATLKEIIKEDTHSFELKMALGKLYEAAKKTKEALDTYSELIAAESEPNSPNALSAKTRKAVVLVRLGDRAGAKALVDEVLKASATDLDALVLRGTLAADGGDPGAAIADFRSALKNNPDNLDVIRLLARAHGTNKEPQLAVDVLAKAIDSNPQAIVLRADLANLYAAQSKLEPAMEQLDAILKADPGNRSALESQFKIRVFEKKWDQALEVADRMKTAAPKDPAGFYFAGLVYQNQKKLPESIQQFESALAVAPDSVQPLSQLVKSHVAMGKPALAEKRLKEVIEQNGKNFVAYNLLGELALSAKRYPDAQRAFEKALSLNEKWAIPYRNLASTLLGQKQEAKAISVMRDGIEKTGGSSLLLTALATYLESVGKLDEAIAEYEAVLKSQPSSPLATNNLAMLLAEYKTDPESLKRAQNLAGALVNSNEPAFLDTAGWVEYKSKNYQKATELLEKAVASASDAALIRFHLGMAYLAMGNKVLAKDNLKQALDSDAEFRGKDIAKAEFAKL